MSRLYIIKPALPKKGNHYTKLGEHLPFPLKDQDLSCIHLNRSENYKQPSDKNNWAFEEKFSCELVGFWGNNAVYGSKGINKEDGMPRFPQYSTAGLTLNSSNTIYGASKELARYYARQLAFFFNTNSGVSSTSNQVVDSFKSEIKIQEESKMEIYTIK